LLVFSVSPIPVLSVGPDSASARLPAAATVPDTVRR
jgi:hypothetical protein